MQYIQKKLALVKEQVERKIFHSYLLSFIQAPYIDEDRVLFLISMMNDFELSEREFENYCLTTMLIQVALDTHENVTNDQTGNDSLKNRQLTVLAGDYYSGLYYKLLADLPNIQMVKVLAKGIKTVNEHKISIYQRSSTEIDMLMESIQAVESSLFSNLNDYFNHSIWKDLSENYFLLRRLIVEKENFLNTESSFVFNEIKRIIFPNLENTEELTVEQQHSLIHTCNHYIDKLIINIENLIKQLPFVNELLKERITSLINQHQKIVKTTLEEG